MESYRGAAPRSFALQAKQFAGSVIGRIKEDSRYYHATCLNSTFYQASVKVQQSWLA